MYQIRCDEYILFDPRDDSLILLNPKFDLEVNALGGGSFTILPTHPYYSKLLKLKSVFELRQDAEVLFRGRMTADEKDLYNRVRVELEGVLGCTNDTIIPPFNFPEDFPEAAEAPNVVEYFLGWIIGEHNKRAASWQQLKLGKVTVSDPNNYISRSSTGYESTWKTLKSKLFDSTLGGYLMVRYEADGNYVDYVSKFELTNPQRIVFGENMVDIGTETDASETYSAIMPLGAEVETTVENEDGTTTVNSIVTLADLPDGDLTDDLVKDGMYIYSRSAVEKYGWVCVPVADATWNDVTEAANLQTKAVEFMITDGMLLSGSVTFKAVDLHATDDEIQSFRVGRNVLADSPVHGLALSSYPLTKLHIDVLNAQNTKITIGDERRTLVDINQQIQNDTIQRLESTKNELGKQVGLVEKKLVQKIEGIDGLFFYIRYSMYEDGHVMTNIPDDSTKYMGTCSTNQDTAPTDYREYTWCKITGKDGTDGKDGVNGKDGTSVSILGTYATEAELIAVHPTGAVGDAYIVGGDLFVWTAEQNAWVNVGRIQGDPGIPGTPGADGRTQYLHIKYSDDGETFTANNGEDLGAWIGTLVDFNEADSAVFADYTWIKFTEDVDEQLNELHQIIVDQNTSVLNTCEAIILEALKSYVETSNYEEFRETVQAQLSIMADQITMNFTTTTEQITNVDGDLQAKFHEVYKHITFGENGITLGSSENGIELNIDNDRILFSKNGVPFGWWDGNDFHTGNIVVEVNERAQFGNFAYIPRSDGSLSFLKVGG